MAETGHVGWRSDGHVSWGHALPRDAGCELSAAGERGTVSFREPRGVFRECDAGHCCPDEAPVDVRGAQRRSRQAG